MSIFSRIKSIFHRKPDFIIGGVDNPYMLRWWVIPRNRFFNIYLHKFLRDDDDRALHDHPWCSCSIILKGGYMEHVPAYPEVWPDIKKIKVYFRKRGDITFRKPSSAHRIELHRDTNGDPTNPRILQMRPPAIPAWTLFITGPRVRDWGFHCPKGWRHWKDFTSPHDTGSVGKGCD